MNELKFELLSEHINNHEINIIPFKRGEGKTSFLSKYCERYHHEYKTIVYLKNARHGETIHDLRKKLSYIPELVVVTSIDYLRGRTLTDCLILVDDCYNKDSNKDVRHICSCIVPVLQHGLYKIICVGTPVSIDYHFTIHKNDLFTLPSFDPISTVQ